MKFLSIFIMFISLQSYSQNWYTDGNKDYEGLKEILFQSMFIKENKQDTIQIKIDDITANFCVPLNNKIKNSEKSISFIREQELYDNQIHDYYDIKYLEISYNIARIGYVQYSESKAVQIIFQRNIYGKWQLLKKQVTHPQLRYVDFVYKEIKKIKAKN
ncbi:hypothetical protein [Aquimarina sp. AU119]|uniref:hypothetical protein n=1 Tax=Aquimarina sp. AU119 TaxID=2108528 RepID=UPI0013588FB9|nr:hypothetical protein [Aquimarina sp. AU119]